MTTHCPDAGLVHRLQARDPQAMAELYNAYGTWLYRVALAVVKDHGTAENVTQEAFLHIWNRIGAFDASRGSLVSWMRTVTRNQAIDCVRSKEFRVAQRAAPVEWAERPAESAVEQWERARLLEGPWSRLQQCDRQALGLAYCWGLSQTEIAERLGRPLGTIKSWMRRGLAALRAELEGADACG